MEKKESHHPSDQETETFNFSTLDELVISSRPDEYARREIFQFSEHIKQALENDKEVMVTLGEKTIIISPDYRTSLVCTTQTKDEQDAGYDLVKEVQHALGRITIKTHFPADTEPNDHDRTEKAPLNYLVQRIKDRKYWTAMSGYYNYNIHEDYREVSRNDKKWTLSDCWACDDGRDTERSVTINQDDPTQIHFSIATSDLKRAQEGKTTVDKLPQEVRPLVEYLQGLMAADTTS
ncbi:MAG: hypothetical protein HY981_01560 [Candidatus Magasanikbacteria bacterium]|nr:hypothetical protein [Candidatus Magasanikbacteria bacterium]